MLLLLLIPAVTLAYTSQETSKHSDDSRYLPVFSDRSDMYMEAGQQFNISCSFDDLVWKQKCSVAGSLKHIQSSTKIDCKNQTNAFSDFDENSMRIIHCPTKHRSSCIVQNTTLSNHRTLYLYKPRLSLLDTGTYICQYNNTITTESTFYMKIGYKPHGPDDISCISEDLHGLNCSWNKSELDLHNPLPVIYNSYFIASPRYGRFDCPHPTQHECSVRSSSVKGETYTYDLLKNFVFYINASTICCGSHITEYKINPQEIVRLSPPIISSVRTSERNITFVMEFSSKIRLALIKNILYEISYKSEYSDAKNFSSLSNRSNIPVTINCLNPFTHYTISIRSKGLMTRGSNYWSTTVTRNYTTKSTVPGAVPNISPGGFYRRNGSVLLYLKPILRQERNSDDARYKIETRQNLRLISVTDVSWETTTVNLLNLPPQYTYQIEIRTVNNIGPSQNVQRITIPAYNTAREVPENILVENSFQNYTVSWQRGNMSMLQHTTVYWCHGNRLNQECKSDLKWITIYNHHTSVIIPDLKDKSGGEWMFAISYLYTDGYKTGMTFVNCYFTSTAGNAPISIPPFNVVAVGHTQLQMRPLVYCSRLYQSRPMQYVIYYKENKWNTCDKSFQNTTMTAGPDVKNVTLRNLKPSTYYTICLSVLTKRGSKTSTASHTKTLAISEPESNEVYIIILCMVGILVLISVAMVVFCKIRNMCNEPMDINLPKLVSLETQKWLGKNMQDSGYLTESHQYSAMISDNDKKFTVTNGYKCKSSDNGINSFGINAEQYVYKDAETKNNKLEEVQHPFDKVSSSLSNPIKRSHPSGEIISNASPKRIITLNPDGIQPNQIPHQSSETMPYTTVTPHQHNGKASNPSEQHLISDVQTSNGSKYLTLPMNGAHKSDLQPVVIANQGLHYISEKETRGYICKMPDYIKTVDSLNSFLKHGDVTDTCDRVKPEQCLPNNSDITGFEIKPSIIDNKPSEGQRSEIPEYPCSDESSVPNQSRSQCSDISDYIKATRYTIDSIVSDNVDTNSVKEYIQV